MNTYETTKTNGTGTACNYTPDCAYKLPCGLCRLLMSQRPKDTSYPNITWTCGDINLASAGRTNPDGRLG